MNSRNEETREDLRELAGVDNISEQDSIARLLAILLRKRRTIAYAALMGSFLLVAISVILPANWTTVTSFTPQGPSDPAQARLSSLAGQFGVDIGHGSPGQSPEFYVDLVKTDQILTSIALDTFLVADTLGLFPGSRQVGNLADLLGFEQDREAIRTEAAVNWLREEAIRVTSDPQTGVVQVTVITRWPEVSVKVARHIVASVNEFNLDVRQSRAQAERVFVEERLEGANSDLRAAEDDLQQFLQDNRAFQNSPELVFQHDRLQRQVAIAQEVYTSLARSYEQARISEVRNTPVISVIEPAQKPVQPDSEDLPMLAVLGLILGGAVGVSTALIMDFFARFANSPAASAGELNQLWRETIADLKAFLLFDRLKMLKRTK
jgi:uncharacterized protein involved in exopolysaccharide biosynthesis